MEAAVTRKGASGAAQGTLLAHGLAVHGGHLLDGRVAVVPADRPGYAVEMIL